MYLVALMSVLYTGIECANYQRYGESTYRYPSSTISNLYNNYPYKSANYANDVVNFPEVTRYPNYSPGYTTNRYPGGYNTYSTSGYNTLYSGGSSNVNYGQGYNVQRYAEGYGQRNGIQGGYTSYEAPFMGDVGGCVNRSPQNGIWVEGLMGMWYGVELIQHLGADSRVDYAMTCIVVHIAEPRDMPSTEHQQHHVQYINAKFRQQYRHLRLLWDEAGKTSEYALYFRNDTAGYWHVYDGQNGTLTNRPNYQQFSGTVQVLKAVNDHLVLNFCQEAGMNGKPAQLYSVLLSRNPGGMNRQEIDFVHALLQNKKLSVASRRMVCGNSADKPLYSFLFSFITCLMAYVVGKS